MFPGLFPGFAFDTPICFSLFSQAKFYLYVTCGLCAFLSAPAPNFCPRPSASFTYDYCAAFVRTRSSAPLASILTDKLVEMLRSLMELEKLSVICSFCSFAIR